MSVICVRTHHDDVLGVFAPIAIAATRPTALVVDLVEEGLPLPGSSTLADIVGGRERDVAPRQRGVACLPNGGVAVDESRTVVERLLESWPVVVLRGAEGFGAPLLHVAPDVNAIAPPSPNTLWVRAQLPTRSPSVPAPSRAALLAVLGGRIPIGRWRRSWQIAWEYPWQ